MSKVSVVYWSQSGNTQAMAEAVAAGITEAGKEAEVVYVSDVNVADLTAEKAFALGCPAMGADMTYLFVKSSVALNFARTGTRSTGF